MSKNITGLSPREAGFLSQLSSTNKHLFSVQEAEDFWGNAEMAWKKLRHLEHKGWLARIERGKYLVIPLEAGPERRWTEDAYAIASILVQPSVISYWSAISHWNWTEQIPRITYIQTTKRKSAPRRTIFGAQYEVVTVSRKKFFGHVKQWRDSKSFLVTDKEKTLIDCADDVIRAGTIEELAKAVVASSKEISWNKLYKYAARFPNGAVKKRLGYLFETLVAVLPKEARYILNKWQRELTTGISPLQPMQGSTKNRISARWRILVNVGFE